MRRTKVFSDFRWRRLAMGTAQIEASKVVQRGLYALWTKHPELRPSERPDLATEVRPKLDQITTEICSS